MLTNQRMCWRKENKGINQTNPWRQPSWFSSGQVLGGTLVQFQSWEPWQMAGPFLGCAEDKPLPSTILQTNPTALERTHSAHTLTLTLQTHALTYRYRSSHRHSYLHTGTHTLAPTLMQAHTHARTSTQTHAFTHCTHILTRVHTHSHLLAHALSHSLSCSHTKRWPLPPLHSKSCISDGHLSTPVAF